MFKLTFHHHKILYGDVERANLLKQTDDWMEGKKITADDQIEAGKIKIKKGISSKYEMNFSPTK